MNLIDQDFSSLNTPQLPVIYSDYFDKKYKIYKIYISKLSMLGDPLLYDIFEVTPTTFSSYTTNSYKSDTNYSCFNISYSRVFKIDKENLREKIEKSCGPSIKIIIDDLPENHQDLVTIERFFAKEPNQLSIFLEDKCKDFISSDPISLPPEIYLKFTSTIPLNCFEKSTIYYSIIDVQKIFYPYSCKPFILTQMNIFEHTFYPYLILKCSDMLYFRSKAIPDISSAIVKMNYENFIEKIIFKASDYLKIDLIEAINYYFEYIQKLLLYINFCTGHELSQNSLSFLLIFILMILQSRFHVIKIIFFINFKWYLITLKKIKALLLFTYQIYILF